MMRTRLGSLNALNNPVKRMAVSSSITVSFDLRVVMIYERPLRCLDSTLPPGYCQMSEARRLVKWWQLDFSAKVCL
jgi:hypothetical protein